MILAIQALLAANGGAERWPAVRWYEIFGLSRAGISSGRLWELITYGLLHGGWWHAGLNALCLAMVGSRIEHMAGRAALSITLLLGIVAGGIGHLVLGPAAATLVGISGGCLALLLVLTTLSPESRMLPIPVSGRSLGAGILLAAFVLTLIDPALAIPGLAGVGRAVGRMGGDGLFDMGHACHLGGGLAGWLYGRWLLRPRISLERLRRDRSRREAIESRRAGSQGQ